MDANRNTVVTSSAGRDPAAGAAGSHALRVRHAPALARALGLVPSAA